MLKKQKGSRFKTNTGTTVAIVEQLACLRNNYQQHVLTTYINVHYIHMSIHTYISAYRKTTIRVARIISCRRLYIRLQTMTNADNRDALFLLLLVTTAHTPSRQDHLRFRLYVCFYIPTYIHTYIATCKPSHLSHVVGCNVSTALLVNVGLMF
ncbi:unnamed protein product [Ceratitis capitata]|uniref:(Mediterranean fruit fly) hypothetical protein n=1 Tax=Ceratitis capitata TaxID=7213 RepID=A0A811V298_CERCA|nr:unnamed protein product [Ceratitis capitata]